MRLGLLLMLVVVLATGLAALETDAPATAPVATAPATTQSAAKPSPTLSPVEVVAIVVEAMKNNGADDGGIATAFEFASPSNKEQTGPLARFIPLVKSPAYAPMLTCAAIEMGRGDVDGNVARQFVKLTGADGVARVYVFILSKQTDAPYTDCWMTDGVMPVPPAGGEPEPPRGVPV